MSMITGLRATTGLLTLAAVAGAGLWVVGAGRSPRDVRTVIYAAEWEPNHRATVTYGHLGRVKRVPLQYANFTARGTARSGDRVGLTVTTTATTDRRLFTCRITVNGREFTATRRTARVCAVEITVP